MKWQWTRVMAACLGVTFLWVVLTIVSIVLWCSWWKPPQPHYGGGDMRFRYLEKDPKVFASFVTASIDHLEEQGLVRCPPPGQFGYVCLGVPGIPADCYYFKSPQFDGYFCLECVGDPVYGCGLQLIVPVTRQPMDASSAFVAPIAPISPPALVEWDKWAGDHGARASEDAIPH